MELLENLTPIIVALIAAIPLQTWIQRRFVLQQKEDAMALLTRGTAYMQIKMANETYTERGWISNEEFELLNRHLILPYFEAGFNGTAQRLVDEIKELPGRREFYTKLGDLAKLDA